MGKIEGSCERLAAGLCRAMYVPELRCALSNEFTVFHLLYTRSMYSKQASSGWIIDLAQVLPRALRFDGPR